MQCAAPLVGVVRFYTSASPLSSWRTISRTHHSCTRVSSLFSSGCHELASSPPWRYMTTSASGPSSAEPVKADLAGRGDGTSASGMRASGSTGGEEEADERGRIEWRTGARIKVARTGSEGDEMNGSETEWEKDCSFVGPSRNGGGQCCCDVPVRWSVSSPDGRIGSSRP